MTHHFTKAKVASEMTGDEAKAALEKIVAELGIGSLAATESCILTCVGNSVRRFHCLSAVESYLTKQGDESAGEDDESGFDDCPLNWGHTREQYLEQFKKQFPELEGVGTRHP